MAPPVLALPPIGATPPVVALPPVEVAPPVEIALPPVAFAPPVEVPPVDALPPVAVPPWLVPPEDTTCEPPVAAPPVAFTLVPPFELVVAPDPPLVTTGTACVPSVLQLEIIDSEARAKLHSFKIRIACRSSEVGDRERIQVLPFVAWRRHQRSNPTRVTTISDDPIRLAGAKAWASNPNRQGAVENFRVLTRGSLIREAIRFAHTGNAWEGFHATSWGQHRQPQDISEWWISQVSGVCKCRINLELPIVLMDEPTDPAAITPHRH